MGNYLKQIYKISSANYRTLKDTGSLTYNGKTYKYDPNNLYLIENNLTDDYVLTGGGGSKLISELSVASAKTAETATKADSADEATHATSSDTATAIKVRAAAAGDARPIPFSALGNASKTTMAPALDDNFTYNKTTQTLKVTNVEGKASSATNADTATKVQNKLTVGSKTYDGSSAVTLTKSDLGLGNVDNTSDATKQVYEANLKWGGRNLAATFSPVDASMIPELGANRFAYLDPAGIEVEYSRDGGATWVDYGLSDDKKRALFAPNGGCVIIGGDTSFGVDKSNYQVRVIITSDLAKIYSVLNKFAIHISTMGSLNCWCSLDVKTKANVDAGNDTWKNMADKVHIYGFPGWNIINIPNTITYGNVAAPSQYQKWKFTFGCTSHTDYDKYKGLQIYKIMGFGGVGWITPSNLAQWGHAYTMDVNQMCLFPAAIYSPSDIYEGKIALSQKYASKSIETTVANKVDKVSGKQLSTNDYTTAEKTKLAGLEKAEALTNSEIDEAIK